MWLYIPFITLKNMNAEMMTEDTSLLSNKLDEDFSEKFVCKYCNFETSIIEDLDEHIITHDETIFEDSGEECEKDARLSGDEEEIIFNQCEDNANYSNLVLEASEEEYSEEEYAEETTLSGDSEAVIFNQCDDNVNFSVLKDGEIIEPRNTTEPQNVEVQRKKLFVCPYCGRQTPSFLTSYKHLKEYGQFVYACGECPHTCTRKHRMVKHLGTHCSGYAPLMQCKYCPYETNVKNDLLRHIKLVCNENRNGIDFSRDACLKCEDCEFRCKRICDLSRHKNSSCKKKFKKRAILKKLKPTGGSSTKLGASLCKTKTFSWQRVKGGGYYVPGNRQLYVSGLPEGSITSAELLDTDSSIVWATE